jgi:hypothetical protein
MTPNAAQSPASGFLGRGPWFWAGAFIASSVALGVLSFSGAIEGRGTILVLAIVPLLLLAAVVRASQKRIAAKESQSPNPRLAQTRYVKRVAIFTSLYLATFALMTFAYEAFDVPFEARVVIALLPGLAVTGMFWAIGRLIVEEEDEFIRMLTVRQTLIASGFALSTATIWGFLESADLVAHIDAYWVAIAWFFGLIIGAIANFIQHGAIGAS